MAKITKSEVKQIISEELERFKKIKSLEAKKASILESIEQIEEGKSENWNKLQELLDVTTKKIYLTCCGIGSQGMTKKSF